jgi:hypothetical protein
MVKNKRDICSIVADAKDGKIPSHEECFWTMLALSSMLHFSRRTLESIAEKLDDEKKLQLTCKIHLRSLDSVHDERFKWMKAIPQEWLGAMGNPFSEENKVFRDMGYKIIKNATGIDLKEEKEND